jgi:hypothetical protein
MTALGSGCGTTPARNGAQEAGMRSDTMTSASEGQQARGDAPKTEGKSPRSGAWLLGIGRKLAPFVLAGLAVSTGCSQTNETRTIGPYTLAISETTTPAVPPSGEGEGVYQTQATVVLPLIDRPKDLTGDRVKPYPRVIWYPSSALQVQLTYVITNLGAENTVIELLVDGFNEFVRYEPLAHVDDEGDVSTDLSMVNRRIIVPGKGRVMGTVSYDDFERMATALAIIMNQVPNPFHAVEEHTDLFTDPMTKPYLPSQIDGLTGFNLSLRSLGPNKIALEATVELIDHQGLLVAEGNASTARPPNTVIHPVVAETM